MNKAILRLSGTALVMIVALLVNLTWHQYRKADDYRTDPRNHQRILLDEYSSHRGQISAGGLILANSVETDNEYRFRREYPTDPLKYGHITGFYSMYSKTGLEKEYDSILNGTDDRLFNSRIADLFSGRDLRGGNVVLTVDPRLQDVAWNGLTNGVGAGPFVGAVVAVRPSTGAILAMTSTPGFDANPLSSQDSNVLTAADEALRKDPANPDLNRATQMRLPPGSTFKVVTTAAALDAGETPRSKVTAAPAITLQGTNTKLTNYASSSCGGSVTSTTLETAFAESCNTAFAELAPKIGADRLRETAKAFGIDGTVADGFPLPLAGSTLGEIPDVPSLQQSSIGQRDVQLTPLQNAVIAATVANNGVRMTPYLVDSLRGPDLQTISTTKPKAATTALTPEVASGLHGLMLKAEAHDSGAGKVPGLTIASKTGTAEHGGDGPPYTWYIAFAPDHDIAVAVVVVSGPGLDASAVGGRIAGPIGRAVLRAHAADGGGR